MYVCMYVRGYACMYVCMYVLSAVCLFVWPAGGPVGFLSLCIHIPIDRFVYLSGFLSQDPGSLSRSLSFSLSLEHVYSCVFPQTATSITAF